jgi:LppP/LprE lipoprotein
MRKRSLTATMLACALGLAAAGCGSSAKPLSATGSHTTSAISASSDAGTSTTSSSSSSSVAIVTKTVTATSTRTSSAPAFTQPESQDHALAAAVATVESQGYTPIDTAQYQPQHTLRVLTAAKTGTDGRYQQRAFFFVDGHYIGTDSSQPSGSVKVASQTETSVTLTYGLYSSGESPCCPGSQASVRFELDNGRLQALDPIPPAHSSSGLSRL